MSTTPAEQGVPAELHPVQWVRTRLRATPLATVLTATLVFVTVFLATALPRAQDANANQALRQYLRNSGPTATSLLATATPSSGRQHEALDSALTILTGKVGAPARLAPTGPVFGERGLKSRTLTDPGLPHLELQSELSLLYLDGAPGWARCSARRGRPAPARPAECGPGWSGSTSRTTRPTCSGPGWAACSKPATRRPRANPRRASGMSSR